MSLTQSDPLKTVNSQVVQKAISWTDRTCRQQAAHSYHIVQAHSIQKRANSNTGIVSAEPAHADRQDKKTDP